MKNPRLLPEHWLTATISTAGILRISASDNFAGLSTFPLISTENLSAIDIERQAGEMVAHEKRIVRGDRALVEYRERGFELRRPAGKSDHRPLLRVFDDRPLAIVERQRHALRRKARKRRPAEARRLPRIWPPPPAELFSGSSFAFSLGDKHRGIAGLTDRRTNQALTGDAGARPPTPARNSAISIGVLATRTPAFSSAARFDA